MPALDLQFCICLGDIIHGILFFDSVESEIAHLAFAIPAVKGIEFGAGFAFADLRGSQANDPFTMRDGKVVTATNKNGPAVVPP